MIEALQCRYPHIYIVIHGDTAAKEGVPHSVCTLVQDRGQKTQFHE